MRDARTGNAALKRLMAKKKKPYDLGYNPNPRRDTRYSTHSRQYAADVANSGGGKFGQRTLRNHGR